MNHISSNWHTFNDFFIKFLPPNKGYYLQFGQYMFIYNKVTIILNKGRVNINEEN